MDKFINIIDSDTGKQVQWIDARYYKLNDKWFPGISEILNTVNKGREYDKWLMANGFNAKVLMKDAMQRGSRVHEAIEMLLKGMEVSFGTVESGPNYTRDEWQMIAKFMDFYTEFKPETIAVEKVLVSEKLGFGSQIDYVCRLNGEIIIVDHKTGNLYDSALMQLSAYVQLWNEYFPDLKATGAAILHLESAHRGRDKSGKSIQGHGWKLEPVKDIEKNYEDFTHVQSIWKRKNPDYKPFNETYPAVFKIDL